MRKNENKKPIDRREFIGKVWKFAGLVALVEFSWVGFSFLQNTKKTQETANNLFNAGKVSDFENGSTHSFRSRRFYLHRAEDGGFMAIDTTCTHLGCAINWDEKQQKFICPCHASHFDINGEVLSPPAPRALNIFPVSIENGNVLVDTQNETKRNNFEKNQLTYA